MSTKTFNVGDNVHNHYFEEFDGVITGKSLTKSGCTFYSVRDAQGRIWHRDPRDLTLIEAANE